MVNSNDREKVPLLGCHKSPTLKEQEPNQTRKSPSFSVFRMRYLLVIITSLVAAFSYLHFSGRSSKAADIPLIETLQLPDEAVSIYKDLSLTPKKPVKINGRTYHGRFLHITDIHPDADYVEGSKISQVCHRGHPSSKSSSNYASKYGDAMRGCDAPMILMNETLKWISENLKDKVDFVIWTGDNIRHDNDRRIPRTEFKIFEMNKLVSGKFHDIFHTNHALDPREFDVDVIPSLGNNDVYPHNLFSPGPTLQTRELWSIWQDYVPQEQLHIFEKGAYFMKEIIPGKLAVISLNTLYWFKANPLVDSCDDPKDPGFQHLRWFGIVLEELRQRGMKVWVSGHVPPMPKNYEWSCYRKYAVWINEYRDVVIGGVFGHMNMDHFMVMDSTKAYRSLVEDGIASSASLTKEMNAYLKEAEEEGDEIETSKSGYDEYPELLHLQASEEAHLLGAAPSGKEAYLSKLRQQCYAKVKSVEKSGFQGERYALSFIGTSVIPTFNPGFRIWEYNLEGIDKSYKAHSANKQHKPWDVFFKEVEELLKSENEEALEEVSALKKNKNKKNKGKKKKKPDPTMPKPKPSKLPNGPAYSKQLFTPTRFVQYYLDLKAVNSGKKKFEYEVEYTSDDEPFALSKKSSLTVEEVLEVARDLGRPVRPIFPSEVLAADQIMEVEDDDAELPQHEEDDIVEQQKSSKPKKAMKKISQSKQEKLLKTKWEKFTQYAFVSSGYSDN